MEMNTLRKINICLFLLLTLMNCKRKKQNDEYKNIEINKIVSTSIIQPRLVDYKSETYNISIGENYKISDALINWHWSAMNDPDDKVDSTGKDAFLFLGEPLINYNEGDWLPSLHIETEKNIITSFMCSILFELADSIDAEISFLNLISSDIKNLQNNEILKSLIDKGFYEKKTHDYIENFRFIKAKEYEYDRFEYTIKQRKIN